MTNCAYCNAKKDMEVVYEDDKLIAVMHPKPATDGHIIVIPKKHYPILEQIPDYEITHIFKTVNKLSIAAFEAVESQGTNIIVQNGVAAGQLTPHVSIHIIPRKEGDNINLQWPAKQMTQEEMSTVELALKQGSENIGSFETEEKKEPIKLEKKTVKLKAEDKGENYLIKQLERIP